MHRLHLRIAIFVVLIFLPALARGDSVATIDVSASFVPNCVGFCGSTAIFGNGPSLFVTGQFTFDENTAAVSSWEMSFLGPAGATYQLSPLDGGVASAVCRDVVCPSPIPFSGFWKFSFGNSNASLDMSGFFGSSGPFFTGEILDLCPAQNTIYPGGEEITVKGCNNTSIASFDNQRGDVYLGVGGASSGILTVTSVVSTPEPSESTALLLGFASVFGYIAQKRFRATRH